MNLEKFPKSHELYLIHTFRENSPKYKWFTYSLNFWGIFPTFSGIYQFFWGKFHNFLGKGMCTLKCGIFPNNRWGKFHKILVIYLFTKFFGNIPYFFWNLSIFLGKIPQFLGENCFYPKMWNYHVLSPLTFIYLYYHNFIRNKTCINDMFWKVLIIQNKMYGS